MPPLMTPPPPPPTALPVDRLVESMRALASSKLPADVATLTRTYLVDSIGVGLAGTITPENRTTGTTGMSARNRAGTRRASALSTLLSKSGIGSVGPLGIRVS